jgi:hypothetical protein
MPKVVKVSPKSTCGSPEFDCPQSGAQQPKSHEDFDCHDYILGKSHFPRRFMRARGFGFG